MHFGFTLDSSDIDLWDADLLETDLDTDIHRKHFVCLQDVLKTSSVEQFIVFRNILKTFWNTKHSYTEDVLKTFSGHVFKTSSRLLKDQQMFAGRFFDFKYLNMKQNGALELYDALYDTFYNHSFCDILINELWVTSYKLKSSWVAFIEWVKSYELFLLYELRVTFCIRFTSYCLLYELRVTIIARVTG